MDKKLCYNESTKSHPVMLSRTRVLPSKEKWILKKHMEMKGKDQVRRKELCRLHTCGDDFNGNIDHAVYSSE